MVLWEEYRQVHPTVTLMRQHHVAGDKVFVDYSGKKIAIADSNLISIPFQSARHA
jgi:hypothetical protein